MSQNDNSLTVPRELYLDLIKKVLLRLIPGEHYQAVGRENIQKELQALLEPNQWEVVKRNPLPETRREGLDWPADAETMIGLKRLENIQHCVADVIEKNVPGDLIETGVWRGGAVIFMRAILKAYGVTDRKVWVADSFQGLPKPNPEKYPQDAQDSHWTVDVLKVSLEEVKKNFSRYDLLDDQVSFLVGWFSATLPQAPIQKLAVARLDGDMYESTTDALEALYPKISTGGYLIVDDYALRGCQAAVNDFRAKYQIKEEIRSIDWTGVYWQKR